MRNRLQRSAKVRALFIAIVIVGVIVTLALACVYVVASIIGPNPVEVEVKNFVPNTDYICIVVDSDEEVCTMNWYARVLVRYEYPAGNGFGCRDAKWPNSEPMYRTVAWKKGNRYGVAQRLTNGSWWVSWFEKIDAPRQEYVLFDAPVTITFDLSGGQTEAMPEHEVSRLGLDNVNCNN
jgi:hypothetical protein